MVRINGCEPTVEVSQKAVAARAGSATFFDTGDVLSNANSLVRTGRGRGSITVETVGVDEVAPPVARVGLLKIDVEGAELDVLRGASRTIVRCRPAVHLSLHPPQIHESGGSLREIGTSCASTACPSRRTAPSSTGMTSVASENSSEHCHALPAAGTAVRPANSPDRRA